MRRCSQRSSLSTAASSSSHFTETSSRRPARECRDPPARPQSSGRRPARRPPTTGSPGPARRWRPCSPHHQHEGERPGHRGGGGPVLPGQMQPPAQLAQVPGLGVHDGGGPGAVDLGGDVRGAPGEPGRFGARRSHRHQPLWLAGLGGEPESFVELPGAVATAAGGEARPRAGRRPG